MEPTTAYHRLLDPHEIIGLLRDIGLVPADAEACDAGRALAAQLISPQVALAITLRRAQAHTGCAIFVHRRADAITGVLAILPLSQQGVAAIEQHLFDPRNPPDRHLSAPGEPIAGLYGWGFVGVGRKAQALMLTASMKLREHLADIPFFTRAATAAGAKALRGRMGYVPYPGAPDDLLWNPVRTNQERAA